MTFHSPRKRSEGSGGGGRRKFGWKQARKVRHGWEEEEEENKTPLHLTSSPSVNFPRGLPLLRSTTTFFSLPRRRSTISRSVVFVGGISICILMRPSTSRYRSFLSLDQGRPDSPSSSHTHSSPSPDIGCIFQIAARRRRRRRLRSGGCGMGVSGGRGIAVARGFFPSWL